jgi:choice-of-anchor B domain-containing protein
MLFLSFLLTFARSNALTCDDWCQVADDRSIMQNVMQIKLQEHQQCVKAGLCPTLLNSSVAVTPCVNGKAGEYECSNVDMLSFLSLADMGSNRDGNDIWGWTDPTTEKEYALVGTMDGTSFVDVTDPVNPVFVARVPGQGSPSIWRDLKVYKNHVFIGSEAANHGMQVFDLTRLRSLSGGVNVQPDVLYTQFGSSHNIVINEESGFLYAVGTRTCRGGLHMVDISSPQSPQFVGCYQDDGYTHDAQCVIYIGPDARFQQHEICMAYNEDSLTIVDVTDKSAPVMLSRVVYQGVAYSHQGWMTEDQAYMLLDDELDEFYGVNDGHTQTYVWDVRSLTAPVVIKSFHSAVKAIDHNLYIKGNLAYESNYEAGLRVLDLTDVANGNLEEVAFFDVHPTENKVEFFGAWSSYIEFPSGTIITNSIERGLFCLKVNV